MAWSLDAEIIEAAGAPDLSEALHVLGLCSESCGRCRVAQHTSWRRWGEETYGLKFAVEHANGATDQLVLKACVALGRLSGVSEVAATWHSRRTLLESHGVSVPHFVYLHKATFCEEFIPYSVVERFTTLSEHARNDMSLRLGNVAGVLTGLGFPALDVGDWRSRGSDVVLIDFGEDLGPQNLVDSHNTSILSHVVEKLERVATVTPEDLRRMSEGFESAREQVMHDGHH